MKFAHFETIPPTGLFVCGRRNDSQRGDEPGHLRDEMGCGREELEKMRRLQEECY